MRLATSSTDPRRWLPSPWIASLLAVLGCATATAPRADAGERIVAVGDLHGDVDNALAVLRLAGVVDETGRWSGGEAVLVQTGDTTDRGADSKQVMDLLRRLSGEAEAAGGRVVPLLGNHEIMNLVGDWRYVHPDDIETFGGFDARRAAFAPGGDYGRWLRGLDVAAKQGDTVFVHGGITATWARDGLADLNADVRRALDNGGGTVLGPDGPVWYRGFVTDPEANACPALEESLRLLGARRMVVGHTTRRDGRIEVRCEGRLTVIDVGIADGYGGHLAAWESIDGDARAVYATGTIDLEDPKS